MPLGYTLRSALRLLTLLGFTTGLLIASAASAQTDSMQTESALTAPVPAGTPSPVYEFKIPIMVWAAAVASDQATTYRFSSQYPSILHETNPLIRGLDQHPAWLVAAGTAMDVAAAWSVYHFFGKRHPRLVKIAFYAAAAYRTHLAFHNLRMMERAQQRLPPAGSTIPKY